MNEPKMVDLNRMVDSRGEPWAVILKLNTPSTVSPPRSSSLIDGRWVRGPEAEPDLQPRLVLLGDDGFTKHEYNVASLLNTAASRRGFFIGSYSPSEPCVSFSPDETARIAALIRASVPRSAGEFLVTWQPDDPSIPF